MARIEGTNGADNRSGTAGADEFAMKDGDDVARGLGGADVMYGGGGDDILYGGDGGDSLIGGAGSDKLYGGAGRDMLTGGTGGDRLHGGADADTFRFDAALGWGAPSDIIDDFNRAEDIIDLRGIDANWNAAGDQAYRWLAGGEFTGRAGELTYQIVADAYVWVYGDNDGDARIDFQIYIDGDRAMSANDFLF